MNSRHLALALVCASGLLAERAGACGVSASGVASCSLSEHLAETRPRWVVGASGLYTSTTLRFSGGVRAAQTRYAALAALAYLPTSRLILEAGIGAALGGTLTLPDGKHEFTPGPAASLGADLRILESGPWFALLASRLSFSAARTQLTGSPSVAYDAFDLRLGAELGVHLFDVFHPYALARAFGGPVFWHYRADAVTGTDLYHYQLGAGFGLSLSKHLAASAEGIPLGERAVSLGLALLL